MDKFKFSVFCVLIVLIVSVSCSSGDDDENTAGVIAYTTCPNSHHPHMIDLGLPSGTLWACCNVGASRPEDYGGYYAWGETHTKSDYTWENYAYWHDRNGNGSWEWDEGEINYIGSDISGTQYDAAITNWGSPWVMPSLMQCQELLKNCSWSWKTQNGANGMMLTGPNGGTIFLPAAGFLWNGGYADRRCAYWSSTIHESFTGYAYGLYVSSGNVSYIDSGGRSNGFSVRPVRMK